MNTKKKLVFATNNPNKLREARQILADRYEIVSLSDLGCHDDIPETAETLAGNALIKARYIHERFGCDCFADDTGLSVDALDGAPGVYSARFAGDHCTPADNVAKLLGCMEGVDNRDAHFSTVIALIHNDAEHLFEGRVDGFISREEEGDGGFGYDPIFVEKESGKSFAVMAPEEKNAVSHRGRAMKQLADYFKTLLVFLIVAIGLSSQSKAAEWRLIPSYDGQMENIVVTSEFVYFLGASQTYEKGSATIGNLYGVLFRYDIKNEEMICLSTSGELSNNIVKAIAYNYDKKYLAVALADGTLELLYDNGTSAYIPGLSIADASLDKTINDITFDTASNSIYLATNFGYVVVNDSLHEIETSKILNTAVSSCIELKGKIYIATSKGILRGDKRSASLSNFEPVSEMGNVIRLASPGGEILYIYYGDNWNRTLGYILTPDTDPVVRSLASGVVSAFISKDYITAPTSTAIDLYDQRAEKISLPVPPGYQKASAATLDGRTFWFSSGREGISCLEAPTANDGKWTVKINRFLPNASNAFMSMSMAYHPDYGMLVRNHGYEHAFSDRMTAAYDLISGYKDGAWTSLSTTYRVSNGLLIDNPWGAAIDPDNKNHVYCGSERSGLFRLDLSDPDKSLQFSKPTDIYGNQTKPGYVEVLPANPAGTWGDQCVFSPPMFDNSGYLWMAYVDPEANLKDGAVSSKITLYVWSPEARKSTVSAASFKGWDKVVIADVPMGNIPKLLVLKQPNAKNLVLVYGNSSTSSLVVLDHGGTPSNTADDKSVKMKTLYDQDGEKINIVNIFAMHEDTATGLVWVAYNDGIFTINPAEAIKNVTSARRIKVPRNDGTNLADYLLNGVKINSITADGSGRKWFGTQGAGLVCTSADGRTIYETYTPDNSSLPGSSVYAVEYNPASNSMIISTDGGLCELYLSGSGASSGSSDVRCYPNPVRPDYFGVVNIDGIADDAMVKIVDTAGNLVKECGQAYAGTATWDITNQFMKRVPGGVYIVVASSGPSSDDYSKVGKILIVD